MGCGASSVTHTHKKPKVVPCEGGIEPKHIVECTPNASERDSKLLEYARCLVVERRKEIFKKAEIYIYSSSQYLYYHFYSGPKIHKYNISMDDATGEISHRHTFHRESEYDEEFPLTAEDIDKISPNKEDEPLFAKAKDLVTRDALVWKNAEIIIYGENETFRFSSGDCETKMYIRMDDGVAQVIFKPKVQVECHQCDFSIKTPDIRKAKERATFKDQELFNKAESYLDEKTEMQKRDAMLTIIGEKVYVIKAGNGANKFSVKRNEDGKPETKDGDKSWSVWVRDGVWKVGVVLEELGKLGSGDRRWLNKIVDFGKACIWKLIDKNTGEKEKEENVKKGEKKGEKEEKGE